MKFSNLEAEITRMGMSNVEFSKKVGIETVTFYNRLKGSTTWKLTDMRKVQKFINENPTFIVKEIKIPNKNKILDSSYQ